MSAATIVEEQLGAADLRAGASRRLRITLCPPGFGRFATAMSGGHADATDIIQLYLARLLAERGHELTFFAPEGTQGSVTTRDPRFPSPSPATWTAGPLFRFAEKAAWRMQRAVGVPYLNEFSQWRIADEAASAVSASDLVYQRTSLYHDGVARACERAKTPYVLFVEADEILEFEYMGKPLEGLLLRRARKAFRRNLDAADCIVCVSSQLQRRLTRYWGVPASKIAVFQNAVDIDRFRPDPAAGAEIRHALGVGRAPLLLFVGSFYRWHDVPSLLRAFRDARRSCPEARLVLVGDGAERQSMEAQARELGVADAAIFTGRVTHEDVPKYLAAADIAVAPYPRMGDEMWLSPLKVYEAMAAGVPVVASSVGQLADLITDGETGVLVPAGDPVALGAAVKNLLSGPKLRRSIALRAREHVLRHHSWKRYVERLESVFEAVVDQRSFSRL